MTKNSEQTQVRFQNNKILYVEPNYNGELSDKTSKTTQMVLQAPHLEDYCIAVDLEVELVDRSGQSTINQQNKQRFLRMQWNNQENGGQVSFMSGSRVYTSAEKKRNINNQSIDKIINTHRKDAHGNYNYVNSFTTDYNDCYYDAIIQHGTTELFGIKSIDIDYQNHSVPHVVMQFTDIRGASLFANTANRKYNQYVSYENLNGNDMAQVFFQCFFTVPYPKFYLTVKGYYGEPVTYELNCNTMKTKFDSKTGNFEATVDFVGYYFRFLSDVPMTALLAAPRTDEGRKYWNNNFKLNNGNPLPTLYELYNLMDNISSALTVSPPTDEDVVIQKQKNEIKVGEIVRLRDNTRDFMKQLVDNCKDYETCTISSTERGQINATETLGVCPVIFACLVPHHFAGKTFLDFIKQNENINTTAQRIKSRIHNLNNILNSEIDCDIDLDTKPINAFEWKENGTISVQTKQKDNYELYRIIAQKFNDSLKPSTPNTHTYVYVIQCNYAIEMIPYFIKAQEEILYLNENGENRANIIQNNALAASIGEGLTIELFVKLVLAHFETLIHLLYECVKDILKDNRTAKSLQCGPRHFGDVNVDKENEDKVIIPPFPLLTINTTNANDKHIVKETATWPGFFKGDKFRETALIKELFSAATYVSADIHKIDAIAADRMRRPVDSSISDPYEGSDDVLDCGRRIKFFANVFDAIDLFRNDGSAFPPSINIVRDINDFYKAIGRRAYQTLNLDYLAGFKNAHNLHDKIGNIDGLNFVHQFPVETVGTRGSLYYTVVVEDSSVLAEAIWDELVDNGFFKQISGTNSYKLNPSDRLRSLNSHAIIYDTNEVINTWKPDKIQKHIPVHSSDFDGFYNYFTKMYFNSVEYDKLFRSRYLLESRGGGLPIKNELSNVWNASRKQSNYIFCRARSYNIVKEDDGAWRYVYADKQWVDNIWVHNPSLLNATGGRGSFSTPHRSLKEMLWDDVFRNPFSILYGSSNSNKRKLVVATILCCFNCYNWENVCKYLKTNTPSSGTQYKTENPCLIIPNLLLLQMGAVLWVNHTYGTQITAKAMRTKLPFTNTTRFYEYLRSLNTNPKDQIRAYFENAKIGYDTLYELLMSMHENRTIGGRIVSSYRFLIDDMNTISKVSNYLLRPVMVAKELITAEKIDETSPYMQYFTKEAFKKYATQFLNVVGEKWGMSMGERGEEKRKKAAAIIKQSITDVTNDMYVSLYGYLKLMYDRWIPNFQKEDWNIKSFFGISPNNTIDRSFHFIDAYFTPIGNTVKVNAQTVKDAIHNLVQQNSFNANMFEFITTILQHNNFMMMCTNNFMNLWDKDKMQKLFNPIPYLEYAPPKRHPDFVCVYTYSPSQRLNIANKYAKDDSFMLDGSDQLNMPYPLLINNITNNGAQYKLPAFGVSYGMQYQSYFTDIRINADSAQLTEPALKTQCSIVGENQRMGGRTYSFLGQDLFDIYSSQSYKCTIKMLGNTWIQPLMYFCLLNIPMFRGSYWISEVSHHVEPKTMITTIKGMRMSKIASPFNQETVMIGENATHSTNVDTTYSNQKSGSGSGSGSGSRSGSGSGSHSGSGSGSRSGSGSGSGSGSAGDSYTSYESRRGVTPISTPIRESEPLVIPSSGELEAFSSGRLEINQVLEIDAYKRGLNKDNLSYSIIKQDANKIAFKFTSSDASLNYRIFDGLVMWATNYASQVIWVVNSIDNIKDDNPASVIIELMTDRTKAQNALAIGMATGLDEAFITNPTSFDKESISSKYYTIIANWMVYSTVAFREKIMTKIVYSDDYRPKDVDAE